MKNRRWLLICLLLQQMLKRNERTNRKKNTEENNNKNPWPKFAHLSAIQNTLWLCDGIFGCFVHFARFNV